MTSFGAYRCVARTSVLLLVLGCALGAGAALWWPYPERDAALETMLECARAVKNQGPARFAEGNRACSEIDGILYAEEFDGVLEVGTAVALRTDDPLPFDGVISLSDLEMIDVEARVFSPARTAGKLLAGLLGVLFVIALLETVGLYGKVRIPRDVGLARCEGALDPAQGDLCAQLELIGFQEVVRLRSVANVAVVMMHHPSFPATRAMVNLLQDGVAYLEFNDEFAGERSCATYNSPTMPGAFVRRPGDRALHLPHLAGAADLFAVHRASLRQFSAGVPRSVPLAEWDRHMIEILRSSVEYQVEKNVYQPRASGELGPTIWGACRLVWLFAFPGGMVRKLHHAIGARFIERDLLRGAALQT